MRFPVKTTVVLLLLIAAGVAAFLFLPGYLKTLYKKKYRHAEVTRGAIVKVVNSTGTIEPIRSVAVGAFVSGPIQERFVDFNDWVPKGQLLATIDPRIYKAAMERDKAALDTKEADRKRAIALMNQAERDWGRAEALFKRNKDFISASEKDQFFFNMRALVAQKDLADAFIYQALANLKNSTANFNYTEIRAPEAGIIIDRKIDAGQTVAASFQTPELFVIAPEMREKMHILASVDEADIGMIREAQRLKMPVHFTVDAYPGKLFNGKITPEGIRMNSTSTQNVVTYPVIVETKNFLAKLSAEKNKIFWEMGAGTVGVVCSATGQSFLFSPCALYVAQDESFKLLNQFVLMPGTTANLSFQVDEAKDALRIPNAALRYLPERELVRPEDRKLLDGSHLDDAQDNDDSQIKLTAKQAAELSKNRNRRHVWVEDGDHLKAIEVITGLSDNQYTQLVTGNLVEGQKLVTGVKTSN